MADVAAQFVELNGALKRENYAKAVEICNKSTLIAFALSLCMYWILTVVPAID